MLELGAERPHLGNAVEPQELAPFPGRTITQGLNGLEPCERQEGQEQKDRLEPVEARGQLEVLAGMTEQPTDQERRQGQQHAAFGNVEGVLEARGHRPELSETRRESLEGRCRSAAHRRRAIDLGAGAFGAG